MPDLAQIDKARRDYNIDEWGAGYFGINDRGFVECYPTGSREQAVVLHDVVTQARQRGIHPPLIIRFSQIIASQLLRLEQAFQGAIREFDYKGRHFGVFPFKVNQRREFIDAVIECGAQYDYGLEVGSKSELVAALSYPLSERALLVCNGFKDEEFVTMACLAAEMGKNAVLVIEGPDELQILLSKLRQQRVTAQIGVRTRLYSKGSGKWENSSGSNSKFGLTIIELLDCLKTLQQEGHVDKVSMLHLHIGSQITEIKKFKTALKEAARIYSKIVRMGFTAVKYLNIGGGVGVDYDGSKTSSQSVPTMSCRSSSTMLSTLSDRYAERKTLPHLILSRKVAELLPPIIHWSSPTFVRCKLRQRQVPTGCRPINTRYTAVWLSYATSTTTLI